MMSLRRFLVLLSAAPVIAGAQTATSHALRGRVSANGRPLAAASVFLLEALDATQTDSAGRFVLHTSARGRVTVTVRRIGYKPAALDVPVDTVDALSIDFVAQAPVLTPIRVQAGAYTAGNERGVTLSALEVVSTPGATADVARAMQTLPGVQNVDEGTGLFVRGGDVSETKVLLNDAVMLSPYNYETPTGNFTVTVNPFLLDGIFFSSGGFGARYGNILSGVADLRTVGRPAQSAVTAVAGLASLSAGTDIALSRGISAHATATRSDTRLLFRVNGATRSYAPAPNGEDVSGSIVYDYRPTGQLKAFAIDRRSALGITISDPSFNGGYSNDVHSSMAVATWKDLFGRVSSSASVSTATARRAEAFGSFDLGTDEHWSQGFAQASFVATDRMTFRAGGDADWRDARFVGSVPTNGADRGPDARTTTFDSPAAGNHAGAFGETDWRALEELRVILGLRSDYSSFSRRRTVDPRLSLAYRMGDATLTAAAGEYHQVSDPLYFAEGIGHPGLAPMRARQFVVGAQVGEDRRVARVEVYDKRYADLVGLTRDKVVAGGGIGEARGVDAFVRRPLWAYATTRVAYSYVDSRRTDPNTGTIARAPFDVTHSLAAIVDQGLPRGWSVASAFRYATGKPFTPVSAAVRDDVRPVWTPIYGAPNSGRLPAAIRLDVSASRVTRLSPRTTLVYFCELENLLDRENIYEYTYNADYSRRIPVRSLFKRSIYVGASLTHLPN